MKTVVTLTAAYLLAASTILFFMMGADKLRAKKHARRIMKRADKDVFRQSKTRRKGVRFLSAGNSFA